MQRELAFKTTLEIGDGGSARALAYTKGSVENDINAWTGIPLKKSGV